MVHSAKLTGLWWPKISRNNYLILGQRWSERRSYVEKAICYSEDIKNILEAERTKETANGIIDNHYIKGFQSKLSFHLHGTVQTK